MFGLEELGLLGLFIGTFLAATILPFSSDALYIAILLATKNSVGCIVVGTLGNWLGSVLTYWLGRLAKWEWLEKTFKVKEETLLKQKRLIDKYGVWLALICWVPIVGGCCRHRPRILQDSCILVHPSPSCRQIRKIPSLDGAVSVRFYCVI